MENIKKILDYKPSNELEENDKKIIISFLQNNEDAYLRSNEVGHISVSAFVMNEKLNKVLFCFHNIYQSYSWLGGHADGEKDLLKIALKEAKEESGLKNIKPYTEDILSLEVLPVSGHFKRGKYVSSHLHLNITYLLIGDESEELVVKEDENSSLKWIDIDEIEKYSVETWMNDFVYKKIVDKIKQKRR